MSSRETKATKGVQLVNREDREPDAVGLPILLAWPGPTSTFVRTGN